MGCSCFGRGDVGRHAARWTEEDSAGPSEPPLGPARAETGPIRDLPLGDGGAKAVAPPRPAPSDGSLKSDSSVVLTLAPSRDVACMTDPQGICGVRPAPASQLGEPEVGIFWDFARAPLPDGVVAALAVMKIERLAHGRIVYRHVFSSANPDHRRGSAPRVSTGLASSCPRVERRLYAAGPCEAGFGQYASICDSSLLLAELTRFVAARARAGRPCCVVVVTDGCCGGAATQLRDRAQVVLVHAGGDARLHDEDDGDTRSLTEVIGVSRGLAEVIGGGQSPRRADAATPIWAPAAPAPAPDEGRHVVFGGHPGAEAPRRVSPPRRGEAATDLPRFASAPLHPWPPAAPAPAPDAGPRIVFSAGLKPRAPAPAAAPPASMDAGEAERFNAAPAGARIVFGAGLKPRALAPAPAPPAVVVASEAELPDAAPADASPLSPSREAGVNRTVSSLAQHFGGQHSPPAAAQRRGRQNDTSPPRGHAPWQAYSEVADAPPTTDETVELVLPPAPAAAAPRRAEDVRGRQNDTSPPRAISPSPVLAGFADAPPTAYEATPPPAPAADAPRRAGILRGRQRDVSPRHAAASPMLAGFANAPRTTYEAAQHALSAALASAVPRRSSRDTSPPRAHATSPPAASSRRSSRDTSPLRAAATSPPAPASRRSSRDTSPLRATATSPPAALSRKSVRDTSPQRAAATSPPAASSRRSSRDISPHRAAATSPPAASSRRSSRDMSPQRAAATSPPAASSRRSSRDKSPQRGAAPPPPLDDLSACSELTEATGPRKLLKRLAAGAGFGAGAESGRAAAPAATSAESSLTSASLGAGATVDHVLNLLRSITDAQQGRNRWVNDAAVARLYCAQHAWALEDGSIGAHYAALRDAALRDFFVDVGRRDYRTFGSRVRPVQDVRWHGRMHTKFSPEVYLRISEFGRRKLDTNASSALQDRV
ncbi:hypothetical protein M885DRAFT_587755 [Pelagophyceae sp. CCMP2097]|nr:hypothetical protein M885DRAFT_587755 [Pelagophyceae sp. CCMP2097]